MNIKIKVSILIALSIAQGVVAMEVQDERWQQEHAARIVDFTRKNNLEGVRRAIGEGADINAVYAERYGDLSALQLAASRGNFEIAQLLVDVGANINRTDSLGRTALMLAAQNGHRNIVLLLLTALPYAFQNKINNSYAANFAFKALNRPETGRDVRQVLTEQLINTFTNQRFDQATYLINMVNTGGQTAHDLALTNNHPEIAEILRPESQMELRRTIAANIKRVMRHGPA